MPTAVRTHVPMTGLPGDANIRVRHPAEAAAWVWHPSCPAGSTAVLRFVLEVACAAAETVVLHVSADQRYQLRIDGTEIGHGPDRCDLLHWSIASYEVRLEPGRHRVEALVWWLEVGAPAAQMTWRGGFLLAADGDAATRFTTGVAPWVVERLEQAIAYDAEGTKANHCGYAGGSFVVEAAGWSAPRERGPVAVIVGPLVEGPYGEQRDGWRLHSSILPEQRREAVAPGRVRAVGVGDPGVQVREGGDTGPWQTLVDGRGPLTIPAASEVWAVIDLGTYHCAYPVLRIAGGARARIRVTWAEALFEGEHANRLGGRQVKGQRDAIDGKVFRGVCDTLIGDGGAGRELPALWWRAGRFIQVLVRTAGEAVTLEALGAISTRYPLDEECRVETDDARLDASLPMLVRGLQMSAHETWVDCPYYEQLMYVGDTRTEALTAYVLSRDDRLNRRALELFDWSRWNTGWVAERYPSRPFQASGTYALLWPLCVHDHWQWRGDAAFARERLTGIRSLLEEALALRGSDHLIAFLPGWSFVDWVPGWKNGMGPGIHAGDSSILNLHLVLALRAAAELEHDLGEADAGARWQRLAKETGEAVVARWWNDQRSLMRDARGCDTYSEHAQCLALLAEVLPADRAHRCIEAWLACEQIERATIYFSYYPLEVLWRAGRGDELVRRLEFWKGLRDQGFTTTVESPEPARSDCHGWGAHPLHHLVASIAGIRPLAPGLRRVLVAPDPGGLGRIAASLPLPQGGEVRVRLERVGDGWQAEVELPPGVEGIFRWQGVDRPLVSGINHPLGAAARTSSR